MPISQLLPDGRVRIYNSNTGETKDVTPDELPQYNPKLVGQYQEMLQSQQQQQAQEQATMQLAESGNLPETAYQALAKANPELALKITKAGGKKPISKEQQKQQEKFSDVSKSIDILEKNYGQLETKGRGKGDVALLMASLTRGAQFGETADYEALRKSMIGPLARTISGEVGVLTDKDISRAEGLLPKVTDDPKLAQRKMDNLREMIAQKGGPQVSKKKESIPQQAGNQVNPLNSPVASTLAGIGKMELGIGNAAMDLILPRVKKALTQGPSELARKQAQRAADSRAAYQRGDFVTPFKNSLAQTGDLLKTAAPAGIEAGLLAAPLTKLGLIKGGAVAGAATGASTPEDISAGERLNKTITGAAGGAVTGAALKGAGALTKAIGGSSKRLITQVFRPNASELRDFKKFTGGLDFADEVTKRDLPFIKGKNGQQILEYYSNKVNELNGASDDFLKQADGKVNKNELIKLVDKTLQGREGRVLQDTANSSLSKLRDDINALPDTLDLVAVNQIKRDLQTAGKAAYGPGGNPSPASEAMSGAAREINNLLESKAPGIKDINKTSQFYHLAKDSVERKVNQAAGSEGGLVTQLLGGGATLGLGASAMTMNPAFALAGLAPTVANAIYRSPKFKTSAAEAAGKVGQAQLPDVLKKLLLIGGGRLGS